MGSMQGLVSNVTSLCSRETVPAKQKSMRPLTKTIPDTPRPRSMRWQPSQSQGRGRSSRQNPDVRVRALATTSGARYEELATALQDVRFPTAAW